MVKMKKNIDKKRAESYAYIAVLVLVVVFAAVFAYAYRYTSTTFEPESNQAELRSFANYDELKDYVKNRQESYGFYGSVMMNERMMTGAEAAPSGSGEKAADYSATNIQVEGVDEADIVKNDGKYIYTITGSKVVIADVYPAESANVVSVIEDGTPLEIFVNENRLAVFGYETQEYYGKGEIGIEMPSRMVAPPDYYTYSQKTFVHVYDVTDRSNPVLVRNETFDGNYVESRMIGDYVYFIVNAPVMFSDDNVVLPRFSNAEVFPTIYYFPVPASSHVFTNIISMNMMNQDEKINNKVFMLSQSSTIYASMDNIYITYNKVPDPVYILEKTVNDVFVPVVPADIGAELKSILSSGDSYSEKSRHIYEKISEWQSGLGDDERYTTQQRLQEKMTDFYNEVNKEYEKTVVHKIGISSGNIEYKKAGEVPGSILNQFSMDEYNDYFRVATTTGHVSRTGESTSSNHIYVLDADMNLVGSLEDLAPGERIYSARFIGNRAYLVTFKKIDPLFVIDMSNPAAPVVLGKLKIPGYSDYLHPYDENHIIGVGKETVEGNEQGTFAWYQGIKLSLFDVTDVTNPKEVSKYNIGDRGTDSYALSDHHAFLFSQAKHLLVIPVLLAEIDESDYPNGVPPNAYGEFVWQGAYVFDLSIDNGFVLKGRVSHDNQDDLLKSGYYYSGSSVKRSLYMDDVLYTISDKQIKANALSDLSEIKTLELPYEEQYYKIY